MAQRSNIPIVLKMWWCSALLCVLHLCFASLSFGQITKPQIQFHGVFTVRQPVSYGDQVTSQDGTYRCQLRSSSTEGIDYSISSLSLFKNDSILFTLNNAAGLWGSLVSVSNAGFLTIARLTEHEGGNCENTFFSLEGKPLFSRTYSGANLFVFSQHGTYYCIGTPHACDVIQLSSGETVTYPAALHADISMDETLVALATEKEILIGQNGLIRNRIPHTIAFPRKIKLSPDNRFVACIGKSDFLAYDLHTEKPVLHDTICGDDRGFMDVALNNSQAWAGIHQRNRTMQSSCGILRTYDLESGSVAAEEIGAVRSYGPAATLSYQYENSVGHKEYPWPFKPFDKACKAWNSYMQLSASSDGATSEAYCHEGLDLDVPANIETYSCTDGQVLLRLTLGGALYWRVAVSDIQSSDSAEAWLHAHLDENSIAVNVGDKVKQGDLLGKVIPWQGLPGGHLHFSRIKGRNSTWTAVPRNLTNPMLLLRPFGDTDPPKIEAALADSKFGFSTNDNGSITYLKPNALKGDIDILVKVNDKCGESSWSQAATNIWYSMKEIKSGKLVVPRTIGLIRSQGMAEYTGTTYRTLAPIMYRIDSKFPVKGWFTKNRVYAHIITNSHNDTVITPADKKNCLNTKNFNDGDYRLIVEVADAAGNTTIDSQDVVFKNGISEITAENLISENKLTSIASQHSGSGTRFIVSFELAQRQTVSVDLYTLQGRALLHVKNQTFDPGRHTIEVNERYASEPCLGNTVAVIDFHAGMYHCARKMIAVR
ncbi:MAG: M23 family metallopeptidase [Chitinivibrionales bacterium]|nr:M23 family metallopeptidase [Chitinivibrionales bacterium]